MNDVVPTEQRAVSVIGLGNVFLGDDGFGPLAVETFLCQYECGPEVEVLDRLTFMAAILWSSSMRFIQTLHPEPYRYFAKTSSPQAEPVFASPDTIQACGTLSPICVLPTAVLPN